MNEFRRNRFLKDEKEIEKKRENSIRAISNYFLFTVKE